MKFLIVHCILRYNNTFKRFHSSKIMKQLKIKLPKPVTFSDLEGVLNSTSKQLKLKTKSKDVFSAKEMGWNWEGQDFEYVNTCILIKKFGIPFLKTPLYDKFNNYPYIGEINLYYNPNFGIQKLVDEYSKELSVQIVKRFLP